MPQQYIAIHHFDKESTVLDEEGDTLFGWYFELRDEVENDDMTNYNVAALFGPYSSSMECEQAALLEFAA